MADLQELLYAAGTHSLLIVLQGRDTAGKDGAIRHLLQFVNVQSTHVVPFKVPTALEASHDFLWRVHDKVPGKGGVTIFNRSHYEDVLVAKVHNLASKDEINRRYEHINHFEKLLVDSGTLLLKFCLHISREEQERRLLEREKDVRKSWKLSVGDWKERELWDDYTKAYEKALENCSTDYAPWRIIPGDHKSFRDLAICEAIVNELKPRAKEWEESLRVRGETALRELAVFRATRPKS